MPDFPWMEKEPSMPKPADWRIKKAMLEFRLRLLKAQGGNILKIVLFGSVARGEHKAGSDIDIFVLLKDFGEKGCHKYEVSSIASRLNSEKLGSGIYISPFIIEKTDYEESKRKSLVFYDIRDEGVPLYDADE